MCCCRTRCGVGTPLQDGRHPPAASTTSTRCLSARHFWLSTRTWKPAGWISVLLDTVSDGLRVSVAAAVHVLSGQIPHLLWCHRLRIRITDLSNCRNADELTACDSQNQQGNREWLDLSHVAVLSAALGVAQRYRSCTVCDGVCAIRYVLKTCVLTVGTGLTSTPNTVSFGWALQWLTAYLITCSCTQLSSCSTSRCKPGAVPLGQWSSASNPWF